MADIAAMAAEVAAMAERVSRDAEHEGQHGQDETDDEDGQVEVRYGSPPLDLERLKEPIHQHRHAEHRVKQAQRLAPLRMPGETGQRLGDQRVVSEQRGADTEP